MEPYPVGWRTGGRDDLLIFSNLAVDGLERTDLAVREWMGLVAYRAHRQDRSVAAGAGFELEAQGRNVGTIRLGSIITGAL